MKKILLIISIIFCFNSSAQLTDLDLIFNEIENALIQIKKSDKLITDAVQEVLGDEKWLKQSRVLSNSEFKELVEKYPRMKNAFIALDMSHYDDYEIERYLPDYEVSLNKYVLSELLDVSSSSEKSSALTLNDNLGFTSNLQMDKGAYVKLSKGRTFNSLKYAIKNIPNRIYNTGRVVGLNLLAGVLGPLSGGGIGLVAGAVLSPWFGAGGVEFFVTVGGGIGSLASIAYIGFNTSFEISEEVAAMRRRSFEYLQGNLEFITSSNNSSLGKMLEIAEKHNLSIESKESKIMLISDGNFQIAAKLKTNGKRVSSGNVNFGYDVYFEQKNYRELSLSISKIKEELMSVLSTNRCSMNFLK